MNAANIFTGNLLKSAGDHRVRQDFAKYIRIINILGALAYTKDSDLLRQMRLRKQSITRLVSRDRASIIRVVCNFQISLALTILIIVIQSFRPRDHIVRVIIK